MNFSSDNTCKEKFSQNQWFVWCCVLSQMWTLWLTFFHLHLGITNPCVQTWRMGLCIVAAEQFSQANSDPCRRYFTPNISLVSEVVWAPVHVLPATSYSISRIFWNFRKEGRVTLAIGHFLSLIIFCFPSSNELLTNTSEPQTPT